MDAERPSTTESSNAFRMDELPLVGKDAVEPDETSSSGKTIFDLPDGSAVLPTTKLSRSTWRVYPDDEVV